MPSDAAVASTGELYALVPTPPQDKMPGVSSPGAPRPPSVSAPQSLALGVSPSAPRSGARRIVMNPIRLGSTASSPAQLAGGSRSPLKRPPSETSTSIPQVSNQRMRMAHGDLTGTRGACVGTPVSPLGCGNYNCARGGGSGFPGAAAGLDAARDIASCCWSDAEDSREGERWFDPHERDLSPRGGELGPGEQAYIARRQRRSSQALNPDEVWRDVSGLSIGGAGGGQGLGDRGTNVFNQSPSRPESGMSLASSRSHLSSERVPRTPSGHGTPRSSMVSSRASLGSSSNTEYSAWALAGVEDGAGRGALVYGALGAARMECGTAPSSLASLTAVGLGLSGDDDDDLWGGQSAPLDVEVDIDMAEFVFPGYWTNKVIHEASMGGCGRRANNILKLRRRSSEVEV